MKPRSRGRATSERLARRWEQADQATRLLTEVPDLLSLRLEIVEDSEVGGSMAATKHARVFVLASTPAFFFIPCGDPRCEEGGHDITDELMRQLRAHHEQSEGHDACSGSIGSYPCTRVIRYSALASFRAPP